MNFKKSISAIFLSSALIATSAQANCFGTANSYSCFDSRSGNSYNVQSYGGNTYMQGYNANTGSNWTQNSYNMGNTTQIYGTTNGRAWNETITPNNIYGTDSHGKSFNYQRNRGW